MEGDGNKCNGECHPIYPAQDQHIKRVGDERILGSKGQFCAAFYHVHEWEDREHYCLDETKCIIGKRAMAEKNWRVQAKTVVAVVKFEDKNGDILYEARYKNCAPQKKHAEDFFKEDIENQDGVLAEIVRDNPNGTITMYLTLQPCNESTRIEGRVNTNPDQSCCEILKTIVRQRLQNDGRNINLCIKAANTNRLHLTDQNPKLRNKAERGIKQLMRIEGVNVSGMTREDWNHLFTMTEYIPPRRDLDRVVQNVFERIHRINLP
jgi:hypothetical protein